MTGLLLVLCGLGLLTAGGFLLAGPFALVVAGGALIVLGLTVDWEALHGDAAPPAP